ncbi:uracil permease-like protein [Mollisia scopiformis]|uniref:Uracil permease-like protein n=1 Tax=Mollisia scopiformis TaxID=149040 RepID=A0A194XG79_MOLSC|nr:uracil permease-like protein [Mollisia scopiformis]KUJ19173.1 uracil permease-like protein [Mollisia scopiformis]
MGVTEWKTTVGEKTSTFKGAFRSREGFKYFIETRDTALDQHRDPDAKHGQTWSNEDLDPTPPEKRTWRWWNYVTFYTGLSFGNWTLGSTMVGIGLNWWQSILVIFASQMISSIAMFFNSRCASVYHIGYPVVARSVFGMWGSYYFVGARAALAIIWYGVQLYSGASFMANILRCIFGHNYTDIPNHIPESVGITTAGMLAFFLFWLVHFPFCAFRPYQLRGFFWFKSIVILPAVWGLFIFCMVNTKGHIGTLYESKISGGKGWFIMYAINSGMGNTATLITNQPDIARWSKTKSGAQWSQLISNPIAVTLSASLGILATAAINNSWDLDLWNPWDLLGAILDRYWTGSVRFAVFLSAFTWMVSILGTNIAANMIPFGSDSSMLFPRYITIPRGQFIVEFLGFAICPWKILASASVFTTFLSGYGLFMASVVAVMICDYYLLTKGNVFIGHLYNGSRTNKHYYYHHGWNIQALIAYICGIVPPFPGFVGTLGAHVSTGATDLGRLGWLLSFTISFIVYFAICTVWPTKNQRLIKEMGLGWEEQSGDTITAEDGTQIVEEGKQVRVRDESSDDIVRDHLYGAEKN